MSQQALLERSFCVYEVPNMVVAVIITLINYPPSDMLWQGEEKVEERKIRWVRNGSASQQNRQRSSFEDFLLVLSRFLPP
jgi:hypothetical protein